MIHKYKTHTREEWLAFRKKGVGGSDAAAIVGMNPYNSAYNLWAEKTGRVPGFGGNLATRVGTYLEEFVAQLWAEQEGKSVRRCTLSMINDKYPWAIANVDRLVVGEDAGLEIKTTSEMLTSKFKGGDFPTQYYCQCVHYMAVTGRARWYLAVLIGNRDFKTFCIERDEQEIEALMEAERIFWDHVQNDTPPEVDGSAATSEALGTIYADGGGEVDLTPVSAYVRSYEELQRQEKELKNRKEDAANHIKQYMQNNQRGIYGDFKISWKEQARDTLDKKALQAAHPELDLTPFTKTSVSRVFRFK